MSLKKILDICQKAGDVPYIEGPAGVGKSEIVEQWAKEHGFHYEPLMLSHQEVGDLIGLTQIDEYGSTTWAKPDWFQHIIDLDAQGIPSLLFFDEINRGQPDVQASVFDVILNHKIHTHRLPASTFIVAAANPAGGKYKVSRCDPALINRMMHVPFTCNAFEWLSWAKENNVHKAVVAFIATNEDNIYFVDPQHEQMTTPRSLVKLGKDLKAAEEMGMVTSDIIRTLAVGKLGVTVGGKFFNFYQEFSKQITIKEVIDFANKHKPDTKSDEAYQARIFEVAKMMKEELLDGVENVVMLDLIDKLANKYCDEGITTAAHLESRKDKAKVFPMAVLLRAVPLEVMSAAFSAHNKSNATKPTYATIYASDIGKNMVNELIAYKQAANKESK